jgi:hypothetical protein
LHGYPKRREWSCLVQCLPIDLRRMLVLRAVKRRYQTSSDVANFNTITLQNEVRKRHYQPLQRWDPLLVCAGKGCKDWLHLLSVPKSLANRRMKYAIKTNPHTTPNAPISRSGRQRVLAI